MLCVDAGACFARKEGAIPGSSTLLSLLELTPDAWLSPLTGVAQPFMQTEEHSIRSVVRSAISAGPLHNSGPGLAHEALAILQRLHEAHNQYASEMPDHALTSLQHGSHQHQLT